VFVPRRRTEHLVDEAVKLLTAGAVVVDLCCGSGAVAVAIAATTPGLRVHAADIDPVAVACARLNLEPLGGTVHEGDLFAALPAALRGHIGLLVVNAPYVPTAAIEMMPREARLHEPLSTLDGGADGLDIQRGVAHGAPEWLAAAGHIVIETSADQSAVTRSIFEDAGLSARIVSSHDLDATVVICTSSQD
jgi:release factor glutamine methyltransferase